MEYINPSSADNEHPWLRFRDGNRVVAAHEVGNTSVGVHLLDATNDPVVEFPALADDAPWASLDVRDNGQIRLVWSDEDHGTDEASFQYSGCAGSEDCDQLGDWTANHQSYPTATQHEIDLADEGAAHPQIVGHGDKQFLLGMADPAGNGQNYGVYLYERCGNGAWSGPELVKNRTSISNDQSIANGQPNLVLNKDERIVHVTFVEVDDLGAPTTGTVYWSRKGYELCP